MSLIERFRAAKLYVITCPRGNGVVAGAPKNGAEGYAAMVEAACRGGADVIQFRDKTLGHKEKFEVARQLNEICHAHQVLFIVNDSTDLALSVQADGVHVGQDDLPLPVVQELVKRAGRKDFLIGKSTHSLEQAQAAQAEKADYIGIGPVFATPTKPTYEPVGLTLVRDVTQSVSTPHVAIGGINADNVRQVLVAGAERVAVVRAVCGAPDIEAAARQMAQMLIG